MKAPVYPFGQVVRGLRTQAGVTILKARELTHYQNYERWESGDTRVGADHLHNIAVAFGVSDDLWLLVFAWLVDRFTPVPPEESGEFTGAQIRQHLDSLPRDIVDFGDHANLALAPMSHRDLALLAFTARYGKGYAKEGESLALAPVERATVPNPEQAGVPVLYATYGDARRDLLEYLAYIFDLGDYWAHLCTVGPDRTDPVKAYGIVPARPVANFGWGNLPDQYGRRWVGDDGSSRPPPNPNGRDLPPILPEWRQPR